MKKEEKLQDIIIALIIIVPSLLFGGYVGMKLWNWFVSDTFGLIKLTLWQTIGLDTAITYFTYQNINKQQNENESFPTTTSIIEKIILSAIFLGLGFIVKQFM